MQWYWWALIVILVLAVVAGLVAWLLSGGTKSPPKIGGKFQTWYGRVNTWASQGAKALEKDVVACAKAGVAGYAIEMMGWARSDAWTDKWLKDTGEAYNRLLKLCRRHGIWLFVSVVNDNMGSGKYGDPGVPLSKVMPQAQRLAQIVKAGGKDGVVVQPVAESTTPAGRAFEGHCLRELSGFPLVYNGGSRPGGVPGGFAYRAWHPFKIADAVPSDALVVSDTGSIIMQLGVGLDGPAHPDTLESWARKVRSQGCPVCCYYAFKFAGHDKAGIKALGRAAK
jgi:hypothetical protein